MAGTIVGANAGVSGNNASLAPTIHASAIAGDLILLLASIRNPAAAPVAPAGYQVLWLNDGNIVLYYKEHSGSEATPTVTFTGGSAGDDTLAQILVVRGWTVFPRATSAISNASAQNITLPVAVTPARGSCLELIIGWKQDDWTSVGTLGGGFTEIGEVISTAGNDAAMVWDYLIQTTAVISPTGSFTVTGGAGAVSKAYVLFIDQKATLTVDEQDAYPPRVLVSLTDLVIGDAVELYRVVGGVRTLVRAGTSDAVTDPSFLRIDAELPFGVPVSYVAVVNGYEYATGATTYTLTGGKVALSDAVTGLSAEVVILAWPEKQYAPRASTFRVGGRNVVVAAQMGGYTGAIELYVETTSRLENLRALLAAATEGVVQMRQPGGYDGVDSYIAPLGAPERRFSQDGSDERRVVTLEAVEVEGWAPALEAAGFTYADLEAAYTGLTYADLAGDYATYLALAQAEF